jgi:3-oxoacyl-[acyl-carrier protein] reductase
LSQGYGRVALVSAGSRGIGAATVRRLAADGWDISFCHYDDEMSALEVEKCASELGARVLALHADVTAGFEVTSWVHQVEEELGPVEAVVSCAGITRNQPLALLQDADWRPAIDTSLDGVFHLCRATLASMMRRRTGRIVMVSSVFGVYAHGAWGSYPAPTAGIVGFTRALARVTSQFGIYANAIAPGVTVTDTTAIVPEATRAPVTETIILRRFGSAAEVADRVAFLLSGEAAGLTGRVLEVRGALCQLPASPANPGLLGGLTARRGRAHRHG